MFFSHVLWGMMYLQNLDGWTLISEIASELGIITLSFVLNVSTALGNEHMTEPLCEWTFLLLRNSIGIRNNEKLIPVNTRILQHYFTPIRRRSGL